MAEKLVGSYQHRRPREALFLFFTAHFLAQRKRIGTVKKFSAACWRAAGFFREVLDCGSPLPLFLV
jgi:hypothetical protein